LTFYVPDDLLEWIEEEVRTTGKTKTQVIVEALGELRDRAQRQAAAAPPSRARRRP
jgi:hypothetical protein